MTAPSGLGFPTLSEALSRSFSSRVRSRGRSYAEVGRVAILSADQDLVQVYVHGSGTYDVTLEHDPGVKAIFASCTCPHFEQRFEACKHIWATVLVCDREGLLRSALKAEVAALVPRQPEATKESGHVHAEPAPRAPTIRWQTQLDDVVDRLDRLSIQEDSWTRDRQILYRFDVDRSARRDEAEIDLVHRDPRPTGGWGPLQHVAPDESAVSRLHDSTDRLLLSMIAGGTDRDRHAIYHRDGRLPRSFGLPRPIQAVWLRLAAESGRLLAAERGREPVQLEWVGDVPSTLHLEVVESEEEEAWVVHGHLECEGERRDLGAVRLALSSGLFLDDGRLGLIERVAAMPWIASLSRLGAIVVPKEDEVAFVERLLPLAEEVDLALPEALRCREVEIEPQPMARFFQIEDPWQTGSSLRIELFFDYFGTVVGEQSPLAVVVDATSRQMAHRNHAAEARAAELLLSLGVRETAGFGSPPGAEREILAARVEGLVASLIAEGWQVEVDGARFRSAADLSLAVTSGVDWFDLQGEALFDGVEVALPALLAAIEQDESRVVLADGSVGVVPEDWRRRLAPLLALGKKAGPGVRFARSQLALIDALLAVEPTISADRALAQAREQLAGFEKVKPLKAPRTFHGSLRGYQEEGLAWLRFLDRLALGGCLADDMGLGKTVQVLAWLVKRRAIRPSEARRPSLVVVPRSLVGNWHSEATRFVPVLRILEHTGSARAQDGEAFEGYDLVITTYGLVRRDVLWMRNVAFDYVILDEAQAIKNAKTATAKAVRLLNAERRLALSGTPVENHPGELLSLFDFLNPGLFGKDREGFSRRRLEATKDPEDPALLLLARSVRPLMLRRRKEEVAKDLPPKIEETLVCELPAKQRQEYDQLREFYRGKLLTSVDKQGLGRSKLLVLEALLRLRQAACHPGLLDTARRHESSAKLDLLFERLDEVYASGHKALVFSQFTTLLGIVRERLDAKKLPYAYLDGRTRKRQEKVDRFQEDPACPFFLISLKAGGLGLNLTAAEYVFLLDPWWNPAVEAQAVDRTHRIGQLNQVFAYRLIASDTVEEKVVELQKTKKALADALVSADRSMLRNLTRDDLTMLLS